MAFGKRAVADTGYGLQDELAATLDSIQERAEARRDDVRGRLAELEREAVVVDDVLDYLRPARSSA